LKQSNKKRKGEKIMNRLMKKMYDMKNRKEDNRGFSLVELIIVIAIMAILVGIVGTQVIPYINKSKEAKDLQIINSYSTAATTAYSSYAEKCTADTTVIVYGTNADGTGTPAKTLETEILTLTGYTTQSDLNKKMASTKGKTIQAIKIDIDITNHKITTQAYSDTACSTGKEVLDAVIADL
jgi:type IV pilus assembly protein PilA